MSSTCAGIWLNDFMTENTDSFLYCRLPGEKTFTRYDFTSADEGRLNFGPASVSPWPGTQMTDMQVRPQSTPQDEYLDCIKTLSDELGRTGGKVVICRQICGRGSVRDILDGAERYFGRFPDMFCFIFYHPVTKWWMGASPELLLESETPTQAATRALAGTRAAGTAEAWNEKNMAEHQFVVDDIVARLATSGCVPSVELRPRINFRYGSIEHLCTPILLRTQGRMPFGRIIEAIHPTPAVCGYPRTEAVGMIAASETWPRNCYGGYISVPSPHGPVAYVILRCIHFDDEKWAVYTGSGITGESDALDEWNETQAKAEPIIELAMSAASSSPLI